MDFRFRLVSALLGLISVGMAVAPSDAATISSAPVQSGDLVAGPGSLINGDFTIKRSGSNPIVGNGVDETTTWSFDFSSEDVDAFLSTGPISSAFLNLILIPSNFFITTDLTGILTEQGTFGESISVPDIPGLPGLGEVGTISIDLIEFGFDGDTIATALNTGDLKQIDWFYQDDAILSFAQLELETTTILDPKSVPEPIATSGLMALGLCLLLKQWKRQTGSY
ncbi:hypothetical protein [Leptothoe sp. PORK10 BA2]|uniref:hypothetical protein n=1 Tax=Leptothoe sp. PORK10 BA2 TaxID=3110254 RepID=UPI002B1F7746|nr:hypothetical protein [Leptothoe sp. PORK10 BA2]MEA5464647.1 hypothetical protein [Leptothoe sp. PORK10 BA2]